MNKTKSFINKSMYRQNWNEDPKSVDDVLKKMCWRWAALLVTVVILGLALVCKTFAASSVKPKVIPTKLGASVESIHRSNPDNLLPSEDMLKFRKASKLHKRPIEKDPE